ncbi:MAG TPA: hypothetical protein VGI12_22765 [Vicinamibacterales bacterium]
MRSITAVELGADTCALASTSVHGAEVRVAAAATLDPPAFPGADAFITALRQARSSLKLPRRCRAVVWGLPDGATLADPSVAPLIEPLTRAGFKVARVVTPCNALGALARLRTSRSGGAMCWLGINRSGVAITVVRPGKLLYAHSFTWDSTLGAYGSQARLLQRYSLVAFLAPEVRRAISTAKQKGTTVDGIVTCGNLPDLRGLTMPLIEELDVEVETLDSLEGLVMRRELAEKLTEVAPAIRLACAGAFTRETRRVDEAVRRRARRGWRIASAIAVVATIVAGGAGAWWYLRSRPAPPRTVPVTIPPVRTAPATIPPVRTAPPTIPPPRTPPATIPAPGAATPRPATPAPSSPAAGSVGQAAPAAPVPASASPHPPGSSVVAPPSATVRPQPPSSLPAAPRPQPATGRLTVPAAGPAGRSEAVPRPQRAVPAAPQATTVPPLHPAPSSTDKAGAAASGRRAADPLPEPLKDPIPKVTAILMAADRRLATIGEQGRIVGVGDTIGRRVVIGIDDRTVLLREPSGLEIRVALGGRVVGVQRSGR